MTPVLHCAAITAISLACLLPASAQQTTTTTSDPQPQQQAAWAVQCRSEARSAPLACSMEQRIVRRETGQQVARLQIQVARTEPRVPSFVIQLPLGLSIQEGISVSVDGQEPTRFDIRTCDASGCYATGGLPDPLLDSFRIGKQVAMSFNNLQNKTITVNFSLADFATHYARIQ